MLKIKEQGETGNLEDLTQYFIGRTVMCNLISKHAPKVRTIILEHEFAVYGDYKFFRVGDEFFILHLTSGTLINWYKHLGRTNTCNKNLTGKEYVKFFKDFNKELSDY